MDNCNWLEAIMDHNFCVYFNVIAKIYVYYLCEKPLTSNKTNKFNIEYDDGTLYKIYTLRQRITYLYRYRRTDYIKRYDGNYLKWFNGL